MNFGGRERRKFERVYFTVADEVVGKFNPYDSNDGKVDGQIMNLSLGGLYFTTKRNGVPMFGEKELVLLNGIQTAIDLQVTTNILLEIVRVENHDIVEFIGYGCQYVEISDKAREQLERLFAWCKDRK